MTDILREEVLKDTGTSRLKQKVLDIISKLRVEARIINTQKDYLRERVMKKTSKSNVRDIYKGDTSEDSVSQSSSIKDITP